MSRKRMVYANKEKILKVLAEQKESQSKLSRVVGLQYSTFWRELEENRLSEEALDQICRFLDVAPEWIQDLTDDFCGKDVCFSYAFHLSQGASIRSGSSELLRAVQIDPEKLSEDQMRYVIGQFWNLAEQIKEKLDSGKSL